MLSISVILVGNTRAMGGGGGGVNTPPWHGYKGNAGHLGKTKGLDILGILIVRLCDRLVLELGGREEPLSISLGKKHSLYTRIQPLLSSLFSLYSAARRVLPEIGPWQCCNPNN